ncbi:MAG: phosphatidate cytidylyltransferase [Burkholderiales bacterium]|nr:phosphatidate cytidylyltransferase [Burkholderiales bacterium]
MLKTRIVTALVLVPGVLAALFLLAPLPWALVLLVVVGWAAHEWARLATFPPPLHTAFVLATLLLALALLFYPDRGAAQAYAHGILFLASVFWIFVAPLWVAGRWSTQARVPMALLGVVILVATWVALVELRRHSPWLALAAMAVVWIADTAAYFAGRAFGRHKLAPLVSPGKTWEGVIGAWVAVAVYALVLVPYAGAASFRPAIGAATVIGFVLFVLLLACVSVIGDLFESLMKRQAGVKDSGAVLPGHGGVLDRIDALLAAMPVAAIAALQFLGSAAR